MQIHETITTPNQSSRGSYQPQMVVCHIADGTYEGTKAWVANAASQVSCHFLVSKEGKICQCVPLDRAAWCNGTSTDPSSTMYYARSTLDLVQTLKANANLYSVSIEIEGYYNQTQGELDDTQLEALVWLIGFIRQQVESLYGHTIPLDRQHIVGHYQINPVTRANCPGQKFPWAELMAALEQGTDTTTPPTAPSTGSTLYRIQVGAFSGRDNANRFLTEQIGAKGLEGFVTSSGPDGLYRVQLGAFTNRENAEAYLEKVKGLGLEAFITQ